MWSVDTSIAVIPFYVYILVIETNIIDAHIFFVCKIFVLCSDLTVPYHNQKVQQPKLPLLT